MKYMSFILAAAVIAFGATAYAGEPICKNLDANQIPKGTEIAFEKSFRFHAGKSVVKFRADYRTVCTLARKENRTKNPHTFLSGNTTKIERVLLMTSEMSNHSVFIELDDSRLLNIHCEDTSGVISSKSPFSVERLMKSLERHFKFDLDAVNCGLAPAGDDEFDTEEGALPF